MPIRNQAAIELARELVHSLDPEEFNETTVRLVASLIQKRVAIDENNADIERKQSVLKAIGG